MKKDYDSMTQLQAAAPAMTIDDETGSITIDLVAYGPIRIVMTADGDIEIDGQSILDTAIWTNYTGSIARRNCSKAPVR